VGRITSFFNGMNDIAPQWELISFVDYLSSRTQFMMRVAAVAAGEDDLCGKKIAAAPISRPRCRR
jgi:hypothetical protein